MLTVSNLWSLEKSQTLHFHQRGSTGRSLSDHILCKGVSWLHCYYSLCLFSFWSLLPVYALGYLLAWDFYCFMQQDDRFFNYLELLTCTLLFRRLKTTPRKILSVLNYQFISRSKDSFAIYVSTCLLCVHPCACQWPQRPEDVGFPGAGVTSTCQLPKVDARIQTLVLWKIS